MDAAAGERLPQVSGVVAAPECRDAALLARAMFNSSSSRVYAPLQLPEGMASELMLGASARDISGGDELVSAGGFEKVPQQGLRSVYWEQDPTVDERIVVRESSRGWRGDQYFLHLPGRTVTQSEFLQALAAEDAHAHTTPVDGEWRPPLVFRLRATGGKWFIGIGQPFVPLNEWRVFGAVAGRYVRRCVIAFRPDAVQMDALLPGALRSLLRLLEETIGPGNGEGTMQQTAWLRNDVQHVVANAVLRPWAVSEEDAYNTRAEVDAGLSAWMVNARRRALRARIVQRYPDAERALTEHYRRDLAMPEVKANAEAGRVLDILLRAHFVFPKSPGST